MAKKVNVKVVPDGNGDYEVKYEAEGFVGAECKSIEDLMSQVGELSDTKETDEAFQNEIPVPVPNSIKQ